jgi:hypothetical protein
MVVPQSDTRYTFPIRMTQHSTVLSLVTYQRRLLARLLEDHPEFGHFDSLAGTPFRVNLRLNDEAWEASRHGVGVMFKRYDPAPNLVVDIHQALDKPTCVDAWRLQQFLESMGRALEFQDAQEALAACVRGGLLSPSDAGIYELR